MKNITKTLQLKKKLINHIMRNGEKKTSEKILLKSIKTLQKESNKKSRELIQISVTLTTPVFKMHRSANKNSRVKNFRETPVFIREKQARTSSALKFVLSNIKNHKTGDFSTKLTKEILSLAEKKGKAIVLKNELQKHILLKKRVYKYYSKLK